MFRSLIAALTCLFVVAACSRPAPTARELAFRDAVMPYCGRVDHELLRRCDVYIRFHDGAREGGLLYVSKFNTETFIPQVNYLDNVTHRVEIEFMDSVAYGYNPEHYEFIGPRDPRYVEMARQLNAA